MMVFMPLVDQSLQFSRFNDQSHNDKTERSKPRKITQSASSPNRAQITQVNTFIAFQCILETLHNSHTFFLCPPLTINLGYLWFCRYAIRRSLCWYSKIFPLKFSHKRWQWLLVNSAELRWTESKVMPSSIADKSHRPHQNGTKW